MINGLARERVTIEPWKSQDGDVKPTYGPAQVYPRVFLQANTSRSFISEGRELRSEGVVLLPGRVQVDTRSRLTLPAGWPRQQPPILSVRLSPPAPGMEHTEVWF